MKVMLIISVMFIRTMITKSKVSGYTKPS